MKTLTLCSLLILLIIVSGCSGKGGAKKEAGNENDTVSVPDTGYTGIKQYTSGPNLIKEVTFKNGVRQGLMKSFYLGGKVRQTFWYENGLREDSAKWYYETGEVFRSTPYVRDTANGIQKQYYRNGRLKAKIELKKGYRTLFFEEYSHDGKLVGGYPDVVVNTKDEYSNGTYQITLSLSDKSPKVRFYRGDLSDGVFDTTKVTKINVVNGIGKLNLKKAGSTQPDHVGVFAEILTNFGNNLLVYKKIDLPYKDLK
jgi:hypothetical protein